MSLSRGETQRRRLLPGSVSNGLTRMSHHVSGGLLIIVALACWTALATWSIHDPSYNNSTSDSPANLLGHWGAVLADLSIQSLGLAATMMFLPLAAWGWHIGSGKLPDRRRLRLLAWPASSFLLAGALGAFPTPKTWPLPSGLGGLLGDVSMVIFNALASLLPTFVTSTLAASIMGVTGIWGLLLACGIAPRDMALLWARKKQTSMRFLSTRLKAKRIPQRKPTPMAYRNASEPCFTGS